MEPTAPDPGSDSILDTEPVATLVAALIAVVSGGIAAANALNWVDLTGEQTTAIAAFVTAVAALIGAALRARVYAPATVRRLTGTTP